MTYQTPDIPEKQILVDFFDDHDGWNWHHRVLLQQVGTGTTWVHLTPDMEVGTTDLAAHRVIILGRSAAIPKAKAHEAYCFDQVIAEDELASARRQARDLAGLLGGAGVLQDRLAETWRISDPAHDAFGEAIPHDVTGSEARFVSRGRVALALVDEEWLTCDLVEDAEVSEWKINKATGTGRDVRLLPDSRVLRGKEWVRMKPFAEGVREMNRVEQPGWPFRGPSAVPEFCQALVASGSDVIGHDREWRRGSGVSAFSATARLHRYLSEALHQFLVFDQLDCSNLAGAEYLVRSLIASETAVRKSPLNPDYAGTDNLLFAPIGSDGAVVTTEFTKWAAGLDRDDAQVLKQTRLYKEEMQHLQPRMDRKDDTSDSTTPPIPKAKAKKKPGGKGDGKDV